MRNFEIVHDRRNTRSAKWDLVKELFHSEDVLPMWVADMDFQAPEAVNNALMDRAKHGIYGYTIIDDNVKKSIVNWNARRNDWEISPEWLSFSPGVVTTLHMAIQALTEPGDSILIQTPVYTPFYNVIHAHNRNVVKNPLILKESTYTIDFTDFENKLKNGVKAFILCSPHNPVGRVWKKEELLKMASLCHKYDVLILSDDIRSDLLFPNQKHIPIASLSKDIANRTVTCMAPSKTFNLAGLQASYIVTSNPKLRNKLDKQLQNQGFHGLNIMGNTAIEAAYNHGEEWLDGLRRIIEMNYHYVKEQLEKHTELRVIESEGTYLVWVNCESLKLNPQDLKNFFSREAKVGLNAGIEYGEEAKYFMRMNVACPKAIVEEGVKRIIEAIRHR